MRVNISALSDTGRKRSTNEDSLLVDESMGLFAVADGMGGHEHGEVASQMALQTLHEALRASGVATQRPKTRTAMAKALHNAASEAAQKVARFSIGQRGMGTTMTAVLLHGNHGLMVHVGDSRLYLQRQGRLRQLSKDHTLVSALVEQGACTPPEAVHHPLRHVLTRALGHKPDVSIDMDCFELLPGDKLLLCSDGLTGHFEDEELADVLVGTNVEAQNKYLLRACNHRGGFDNITSVLVHIESTTKEDTDNALRARQSPRGRRPRLKIATDFNLSNMRLALDKLARVAMTSWT